MQLHKHYSTPAMMQITIKNQLIAINGFNQRYWEFARRFRVEQAVSQSLILAFDELLSNIIHYAYHDEAEHEIDIRVDVTDETVIATISDDGQPFDPFGREEPDTTLALEAREIGGLGIHLVRQVIDECTYQHRNGKNVVTLIQHRQP